MKKLNGKMGKIIIALCETIVGILLLVNPIGFTVGIISALGILLIIVGIIQVTHYFRIMPTEAVLSHSLSLGLLEILAGVFLSLRSGWLVATFPLLAILYGVGILILGVYKLAASVDLIRLGKRGWPWLMASAVITLICAGVIIRNPFVTTTILWRFAAISLIAEAVLDVISFLIPSPNERGWEKKLW